jgi:endonuclease/exonuclease/phosphatase family metal-dependent hydrolase
MIEVLDKVTIPLIVMGDFNCGLDGGEDSLRLLVEALDLMAWEPPEGRGQTFPSKKPKQRIDYILISNGLEFVACVTPPKRLTDHLPVIAVIRHRNP